MPTPPDDRADPLWTGTVAQNNACGLWGTLRLTKNLVKTRTYSIFNQRVLLAMKRAGNRYKTI